MKKLTAGKNPPHEVNVFVEIPQGSSIKYELDKESEIIFVDRFSYTAMQYPFNYGFVPGTQAEDGDPLDVLILSSQSVAPGVVIPCRPIGMLEMEDEEGIDTKILAVPTVKVDPFYAYVSDIDEIGEAIKNKIKHFFDHYKEIEPGKWVKTRKFLAKDAAYAAVKKALK
ncbi:MAG TPA: inorganic diphosphatase [Patescibacteria group bacterium]|nr:inorganic diphosphatase [Patescibacteria group bacterium]